MNDPHWLTHVDGRAPDKSDHDELQKNRVWILMKRRLEMQQEALRMARLAKDYPRDHERHDAGQTVAIDYVLALGQNLAKEITGEQ